MSRSTAALVAASLATAVLWLALGTRDTLQSFHQREADWSGDFRSFYLPDAEYAAARWSHGQAPLWYPNQGAGGPFLATLQPAALYPPAALHLLLPVQTAFVLLAALHVALAVFGAGALARALGAGALGAAVSGVAYGTSVQVIGNIWSPPTQYAVAWVPLVWLAVDRILDGPSLRRTAALAAAVGLQALTGWPYTLAITLLSAAGYAAVVGIAGGVRTRRIPWRPALACGAGVVAGLLLASPLLLPAQELVARSCRAIGSLVEGQAVFNDESHRVSVFWATLVHQGVNDTVPGLLTFVLAIAAIGLRGPGRGRAIALFGIGLFFLAASFPNHTPVYGWLREVPVLGDFRFPFRYRLVLSLAIAVAAGVGVSEIQRRLGRGGRVAGALLLAGVVATAAVPVFGVVPRFARQVPEPVSLADELGSAPGAGAASGRIYWAGRSERLRAPENEFAVHDLEPLFLARTAELVTFFETGRPRTVMDPLPSAAAPRRERLAVPFYGKLRVPAEGSRARILDLLSVTTVVTENPPGWLARRYEQLSPAGASPAVFANPHALPRAYRATRAVAERASLGASMRHVLSDAFDPATDVLLDDPPPALRGPPGRPQAGASAVPVTIEVYDPERVVLRTEGDRPAIVVLTDAWYPGWEATVDGSPAPIHRANLLFRGVLVPAGEHRVEMRYRPASFRVGVLLAVGTALAIGFVSWPRRA